MPLTTTTLWPTLTEGKKAKASEVEAKFDWLEGDQWPMKGGECTTSVYDVGSATYQWRYGYFSSNVVIGGTTITSAAVNTPKAWISLYESGGDMTDGASFGISSYVVLSTGSYRVNFSTNFSTNKSYGAAACSDGNVFVFDRSTTSAIIEHRNYATDALESPLHLGVFFVGNI